MIRINRVELRGLFFAVIFAVPLVWLSFVSFVLFVLPAQGGAEGKKKYEARSVPHQLLIKFKHDVPERIQKTFLASRPLKVIHQFDSNGAFLIEGLATQGESTLAELLELGEKDLSWREAPLEYVEPNWYVRTRIPMGQRGKPVSNRFTRSPNLPHNLSHSPSTSPSIGLSPNDPRFREQDPFHPSYDHRGHRSDIRVAAAWDKSKGSKEIKVAVIDTGVDVSHPDLAPNLFQNPGEMGLDEKGQDKSQNLVDDDGNGFVDDWRGWDFFDNDNDPMDPNGHGTHCAGTIGAVGHNGIGIAGLNWNVSLLPLRFLDAEGVGTVAQATMAVEYAIRMGVHIMNNSWGGDEFSYTLEAAIRKANERGILFVVAAGNFGNNNDLSADYPASFEFDNVLAVAATDKNNELPTFSNFGPKRVHMGAPGVAILSTLPRSQYGRMDGTSMAAPFISGAAALVKSLFPHFTALELKQRLMATSEKIESLEGYTVAGRLNLEHALDPMSEPPLSPQDFVIHAAYLNSLVFDWVPLPGMGRRTSAYPLALSADPEFPSSDLFSLGRPLHYEARVSKTPVQTEQDWLRAHRVDLVVGEEGIAPSKTVRSSVQGLFLNEKGYLSIRSIDELGQRSVNFQNWPFATRPGREIFVLTSQNLSVAHKKGPWGVERLPDRGDVIADSPGGSYGYEVESILTLPEISINDFDVVVSLETKYDFEPQYDFGYLELSVDGGRRWIKLDQFNGVRSWTTLNYSLRSHLEGPGAKSFLLRLRVTSDRTHSHEGWFLKKILVLQ